MSQPKLYYFNVRGLGEIVRLTFAAAGVDFEDNRVEREQWQELKKTAPTGVMPWVEDEAGVLVQSRAIARYYAKKHGLMGKSDWEYYLVERAMCQIEDVVVEITKVFYSPDDKKPEAIKNFKEGKGLSLLQTMESFLKDGGSSGLFVASGLTVADVILLHVVEMVRDMCGDFVEKFPKLKAHTEKVKEVSPSVRRWLETRPKTDH